MQRVEIRNPIQPDPDNLSVKNCGAFDMCRGIDNQRVALRPIRPVDRLEPHASVPNVNLETVSIVLQFMCPARSTWELLGDDRLAWMNESGRRI